ncbi:MFS transporter, MCP family, solute carrier family 16, member 6 [Geopyxis carbonaria]|nr:MFS transporter, MCP family, solute carrier family 16, member 6 [Geopyxis carbonaria]
MTQHQVPSPTSSNVSPTTFVETPDIEVGVKDEQDSQQIENSISDVSSNFPNGGYGWVCVAACFTINAFTWGVVSSYGVYLSHYLSHSIFPTATPTDYAFICGLTFASCTLSSPLITIICRRLGPKPPMIAGSLLLAAALTAASYATHISHLYLSQGAAVGLAVGCLYLPSTAVLSQWFTTRLSLSSGLAAAGSGIGGFSFSLATGSLLSSHGVPTTLRVTAALSGTATLLASLALRHRNRQLRPSHHPASLTLLRRRDIQLLLAWSAVSMLGYCTVLFSLTDYARLPLHSTPARAAAVTATMNAGTALGRPWIGAASDRWGRFEVAGTLTAACGVAIFTLWLPVAAVPHADAAYALLLLFALVAGAIVGVFWATIAPLCVQVAGVRELPSTLSLTWLSVVLPTAFAEVVALRLRSEGGEGGVGVYLKPQVLAGAAYLVAAGIMEVLRREKRRQVRVEAEREGEGAEAGL